MNVLPRFLYFIIPEVREQFNILDVILHGIFRIIRSKYENNWLIASFLWNGDSINMEQGEPE